MKPKTRRVVSSTVVIAMLLGLIVAVAAITRSTDKTSDDPDAGVISPTAEPSVSSAPEPGPFPGFWPSTTFAEATSLQAEVDSQPEPSRTDIKQVAARFLDEVTGWGDQVEIDGNTFEAGIDVSEPTVEGSATNGWTANVPFRRYRIDDGTKRPMGDNDNIEMFGLKGAARPVWFVTALKGSLIRIDAPDKGASVELEFQIKGEGVGFEGTLVTEVRDDTGKSIYKGFVNAGSTEPAPFDGQISLASAPETGSGILLISSDQGAEGPSSSLSIIRLRFA